MEKRIVLDYFHVIGLLLAGAYWIIESLVEDWIFREGSFLDRLFLIDAHKADHRLLTTILIILFGFFAHSAFQRQKRADKEVIDIKDKMATLAEERRIILESSQDMIYRHNTEGKFTYVSPSIKMITGYKVDDWLTHYTAYLTDNPVNNKVVNYTEETLRTGKDAPPYLVEVNHKDGHRVMLEVREHAYYEGERIAGIIGIARDVREKKKTEEVIVRQRDELKRINSDLSAIHQVSMVIS